MASEFGIGASFVIRNSGFVISPAINSPCHSPSHITRRSLLGGTATAGLSWLTPLADILAATADSATLGTSIGDRPHFQAHTLETEKRLYISRPTLGRVSRQWSVQVSYPISQGNRFGGVVVLSINPDYLSNNLRDVFTQGNDAALLLLMAACSARITGAAATAAMAISTSV